MQNNTEVVRIIPLGGCREIGKNSTIFEYCDDIIVIDFGVMFPEADMHGVELVIPDMTYLLRNRKKVRGIVLTHGHEDHIGALSHFIRQLNVPIYGTKFTLALVKNRLLEHRLMDQAELIQVEYRQSFTLGAFALCFFKTTHSIAESAAILIETPVGKILHTGDFKIDHTPIDNRPFDFYSFAKLGEEGLLAILSDSTNVETPGFTLSEREIYHSLRETFKRTKGRIFVATFASNIHRIQIMFDLAREFNKKIAITGRSMESNIQIARKNNYLQCTKDQLLTTHDLKTFPRNRTILITTGTQGEPMSALSLLAHEKHQSLMIEEGDTVIISASVIPGNEKGVSRIINNLMRCGANVIYESIEDIHVSGHGHREELKLMLSLTKPKFFIPVHGEYRNLKAHAKLAHSMGIHKNNIQVMENGDVIELSSKSIHKARQIPLEQIFIHGKSTTGLGPKVISDRKALSEEGVVILILTPLEDGEQGERYDIEILSHGFLQVQESRAILQEAQKLAIQTVHNLQDKKSHTTFHDAIETAVKNFFYHKIRRRPVIITHIHVKK